MSVVVEFMTDRANDIDELLDSALDDFQNLSVIPSAPRVQNVSLEKKKTAPVLPDVKGLGIGLSDLKSNKKGKQKVSMDSHVSEALEKLREQTKEAVKGLESVSGLKVAEDNLDKDGIVEDWVNQFEDLAGSQDMESIVETMMHQLLSKEILYEPMKEICGMYPNWLDEHKGGLSKHDYDRFCRQYELIDDLTQVYETDPSNFTKIVDLMQKMQECGEPPNDIVHDLTPGLDIPNLQHMLSRDMCDSNSNCSVM